MGVVMWVWLCGCGVFLVVCASPQVYQLMHDLSDHSEPVTGLHMEPFPERISPTQAAFYVIASTPKRCACVCVCVRVCVCVCVGILSV